MANINLYTKKSTANLIDKANKMPLLKSQPSLFPRLKTELLPIVSSSTGAYIKQNIVSQNQTIREMKKKLNPKKTWYEPDKKQQAVIKNIIKRSEAFKKLLNDELTFRKNNRDLYNQSLKQTKRMKARM